MENKIMKTKMKLGKPVSCEIYGSVHTLNYSSYISVYNSGTNSIWDSVGNSVTNPINDLARWMIAL
jgi:hypothetical protein